MIDFNSEIFSWVRGGVFVLFICHLILYFQNRKKIYLYYSIYLCCLFVYFLKDVFASEKLSFFFLYMNFPIQFMAYSAYVFFARELLKTAYYIPKTDKVFLIAAKALIILSFVFCAIQIFIGYEAQEVVFTIIAPLLTVLTLKAYQVISKIPEKQVVHFLTGSIIYLVFTNLSFLELLVGKEFFNRLRVEPMLFMYLGTIIQSVIFALLVGNSIKKLEGEKRDTELKLAFKSKQMAELKMTALQSQMNPHFLFNSLNSINNYVLQNQVDKASDYITKFSSLMRNILKSSECTTITLAEELGVLGLYIKLEQMRIKGSFDYIINIDNSIDLDKVKVPPLFLQPYIENSIWHGLMNKEGEKKIELTVKKNDGYIYCTILDNGIGIEKSKERNNGVLKRKSFSTQATEERIKLLYENKDVFVKINDISNAVSSGTEVCVKVPC